MVPNHPNCPGCGGFSRYVSNIVIWPEQPLSLKRFFYCPKCALYARADRDGEPMEGMSTEKGHDLRQKLVTRMEAEGVSKEDLKNMMGLKPWKMDIDMWSWEQCIAGLNALVAHGAECPEDMLA